MGYLLSILYGIFRIKLIFLLQLVSDQFSFIKDQTHNYLIVIGYYCNLDTIKSHVDINVPGEGIHVKISGLDLIKVSSKNKMLVGLNASLYLLPLLFIF